MIRSEVASQRSETVIQTKGKRDIRRPYCQFSEAIGFNKVIAFEECTLKVPTKRQSLVVTFVVSNVRLQLQEQPADSGQRLR